MTRKGLEKILNSPALSPGEKKYIKDVQYRMGGGFTTVLFEAIARADENNLRLLAMGFPDEVQAYKAWTRGDLADRCCEISGEDL